MSESKPGRKPRKRLAPSEKYEVFVQVLMQQATQREAALFGGRDQRVTTAPKASVSC